ncbi:MAG TPA: pirin family protein [Candidatus Merdenecus merdavium]|nr:pirin family protein [Candidatus Merdenecus merdavium]
MKTREIKRQIRGQRAVDGAGVELVRVVGHRDVYDFDPFLLMDGFDSENPEDYMKGFPMHPHRGIETLTYLLHGEFEHKDSLGNVGSIKSGEAQWMTAGSGILHEEMPKVSKKMLGLQLWINLPQKEKMSQPEYHDLTKENIKEIDEENAFIRVLSGNYKGKVQGFEPQHVKASVFDVTVKPGKEVVLDTKEDETVYIFFIDGNGYIGDEFIPSKTAVLFGEGSQIKVKAPEEGTRFVFFSGKPLKEPIALGGPVVMNTQEELNIAFKEMRSGEFIKHKPMKE